MSGTEERNSEPYSSVAVAVGLAPSERRLNFQMNFLFDGIDLTNRRVLDIGGGSGLCTFYAACKGAKEVICIEPEGAGSSEGQLGHFAILQEQMKCSDVVLKRTTFQEFDPAGCQFDVIILCNSINHLDEEACINLLHDERAKHTYAKIFAKLFDLSAGSADLIICDCTRYSFFPLIKMRNPFHPTIEWHKHQSPQTWAKLLSDAGFVKRRVRWSSFTRLGRIGGLMLGNVVMAFFLNSHFCLTMTKE